MLSEAFYNNPPHRVEVPYINVNDVTVILLEWYFSEGDWVTTDQSICVVETSKTSVEIEAGCDGFVKGVRYQEGDCLPVKSTLCYIVEDMSADLPEEEVPPIETTGQNGEALVQQDLQPGLDFVPEYLRGRISKKAWKLSVESGVDPAMVKPKGFIKEDDILGLMAEKGKVPPGSGVLGIKTGPEIQGLKDAIFNDPKFKDLNSRTKVLIYQHLGGQIGSEVQVGAGSIILADQIVIGNEVSIGRNVIIDVDKMHIEDGVRIGNDVKINTGCLHLGQGTVVSDFVSVDLSGGKTPQSALLSGSDCLIAGWVYINTSRQVKLGDRVALSPRCQIYTHSFWQSILEGYSVNFNPVTLQDNCWVGSSATIMPGIKVGRKSIILSNSLVYRDVPPEALVGGVPARIQRKKLLGNLPLEKKVEIFRNLLLEFTEYVISWGHEGMHKSRNGFDLFRYQVGGETTQFLFLHPKGSPDLPPNIDVLMGFQVSMEQIISKTIIDMSSFLFEGNENSIVHEFRDFLRRRGIILGPGHWHYALGKGLRKSQ